MSPAPQPVMVDAIFPVGYIRSPQFLRYSGHHPLLGTQWTIPNRWYTMPPPFWRHRGGPITLEDIVAPTALTHLDLNDFFT